MLVGCGAASVALSYFSRRYAGEIALVRSTKIEETSGKASSMAREGKDQDLTKVRFSSLDFWGNREDIEVLPGKSIVPPFRDLSPREIKELASRPAFPLEVSSPASRKYIMSLRYGDVQDKEGLKCLLEGRWDDLEQSFQRGKGRE